MNFFKQASSLLGLAVLSVTCASLAAQAATVEPTAAASSQETAIAPTQAETATFSVQQSTIEPIADASAPSGATSSLQANQQLKAGEVTAAEPAPATASTQQPEPSTVAAQPAPVSTSAAALKSDAQAQPAAPSTVAQFEDDPDPDLDPAQATVSSPSYVGAGASFDFDGGDLGITILSKIGLSNRISVRPSAVTDFSDSATVRVPVTLDFAPRGSVGRFNIAPYLGAGVAFGIGDDTSVGPNITAGLDVPVSPQFTATAGLNVDFLDDTEFQGFVGLGYNFANLFR